MDDGRPQVGGGKPVLERTGDKRRTQCSSHLLSRQVNVDDMKEGWFTWDSKVIDPPVVPGYGVDKLGLKFLWTSQHKKACELIPLRQQGDEVADTFLEKESCKPKEDILPRLPEKYLRTYQKSPRWLDKKLLQLGQRAFRQYLLPASVSLFYLSLCAGFSAPLIVNVIVTTGYLTGPRKKILRRLIETAYMVISCMVPGGLDPGSKGWEACTRVRFLHAKVRRRLSKTGKAKLENVAINQEDLSVTLLAFSYNVLIGIEFYLGRPLSDEEQRGYLHVWRYIGFLMGIKDEVNPCRGDVQLAKAELESMLMHLIHPDEGSRKVVHHMLSATGNSRMPYEGRTLVLRSMMGDRWSDAMQLPKPSCIPWSTHLRVWFFFFWVKLYTRISSLAVVGYLLEYLHTYMLNWILRKIPAQTFPMSHPPVSDADGKAPELLCPAILRVTDRSL
ncbi:hypothetical protein AAMO2058_000807500 [Amorphochlora amoebiformis]